MRNIHSLANVVILFAIKTCQPCHYIKPIARVHTRECHENKNTRFWATMDSMDVLRNRPYARVLVSFNLVSIRVPTTCTARPVLTVRMNQESPGNTNLSINLKSSLQQMWHRFSFRLKDLKHLFEFTALKLKGRVQNVHNQLLSPW